MTETESLWRRTAPLPRRERLTQDLTAGAVVIGAGMAGALIAERLQRRGVKTVVLEARRAGGGQTKNTTAKITSQHGLIYRALIERFGRERARQYAAANEQAVREYARLVDERRIDCDFEQTDAILYSRIDQAAMRREAEAAAGLGIDAAFSEEAPLPFPTVGAVRFARQARFHPLKFLNAICQELTIYEDSPVIEADEHSVRTPEGRVRAEHIVFACHYPFVNVPGFYFMRMHQERSYVLALESDWQPQAMFYGADEDGLSLRAADGLLLLGGENHRTGENTGGGRYEALLARAKALFPGCREVTRWSAQDCMTLDGVPYIGAFAPSRPGWYVATGFGKWGMTSSMASAMLLEGAICGGLPDWADVFSPARFNLSVSAGKLASETAQAAKGLAREVFAPPRAALDDLPPGHGGIVEAGGKKAGVYKDEEGRCHIVDPRCPHLGCQLEWNPDEKSWDCPCHGSRFSFDGELIDNPAQEGLNRAKRRRESEG